MSKCSKMFICLILTGINHLPGLNIFQKTGQNLYLDSFQIEIFLKITDFGICKIKPLLIQRFAMLQI